MKMFEISTNRKGRMTTDPDSYSGGTDSNLNQDRAILIKV
jgi:hypothetical protein